MERTENVRVDVWPIGQGRREEFARAVPPAPRQPARCGKTVCPQTSESMRGVGGSPLLVGLLVLARRACYIRDEAGCGASMLSR